MKTRVAKTARTLRSAESRKPSKPGVNSTKAILQAIYQTLLPEIDQTQVDEGDVLLKALNKLSDLLNEERMVHEDARSKSAEEVRTCRRRLLISQREKDTLTLKLGEVIDRIDPLEKQVRWLREQALDLEKRGNCCICWETPVDTAIVDCGHTFCARCLQRNELALKGSRRRVDTTLFSCPSCRTVYNKYDKISVYI